MTGSSFYDVVVDGDALHDNLAVMAMRPVGLDPWPPRLWLNVGRMPASG